MPNNRGIIFGDCSEQFMKTKDHCFINQGSWGSIPEEVYKHRLSILKTQECLVDKWYRIDFANNIKVNWTAAAKFLNSDPSDLISQKNATSALNIVMKNIKLTKEDAILVYSWTYGSVLNIVERVSEITGAQIVILKAELPMTKESIICSYHDIFKKHKNIKISILDGISSATAVRLPFEDLIGICKSAGSQVLIDGAHLLGQVHLDIKALELLGLDYFVGNFHKWAFVPRGCAFLWVNKENQALIKPLITSAYHNLGFQKDFSYFGTDDDSSLFSTEYSLQFYRDIGGLESISAYNCKLLDQAVELLTRRWGTECFEISKELQAPFMRVIELPKAKLFDKDELPVKNAYGDLTIATLELSMKYNIYTVLVFINGRKYIRISAQIYNKIEDYERLCEVVEMLMKQ